MGTVKKKKKKTAPALTPQFKIFFKQFILLICLLVLNSQKELSGYYQVGLSNSTLIQITN